MGLFWRRPKAQASAETSSLLRLRRSSSPDVLIDLSDAPWLGFVQVGDEAAPVFEGWWLVGTPGGAVAVADDCPMVDALLRTGALAAAAEAVAEKFALFLMSRPTVLRSRDGRDGVVQLDTEQAASLRSKGTTERARQVADLPVVA